MAVLPALVWTAFVASACGTPCSRIADDRARFLRREGGTAAAHFSLEIPFALANGLIAARLRDVPSTSLRIDVGDRLRRFVGDATLVPTRIELRPAPADRLGLHVVLDLSLRRRRLFALHLDADLRPELNAEAGTLELGIRPDDLRRVRPELTDGGRERVAEALRQLLPPAARRFLPTRALTIVAGRLLSTATESVHAALRGTLSSHIGEIARVSVRLPGLPVTDLRVRSAEDRGVSRLVIDARTRLPVSAGLPREPMAGEAPPRETIRLRLAGAMVAELGNWAIARGELPARYDRKGHPDEDGEFEAGLAWVSGPRPLKIELWKTSTPCLEVRLGATPELRVEGDRLRLAVDDGTIESVKGPPLVELGAWFYRLGADAIRFSGEMAARMRFSVAGSEMRAQIRAVRRRGDDVALDVYLSPIRQGPARE